jgi:valyl-tRNA synthetase
MELFIKKNTAIDATFDAVIVKMGNLSLLEYVTEKVTNANSFLVNSNEYYIPFGDSIDLEAEKKKLNDELVYTKGFLQSVQKKLQNEKFMSGAPEQVVQIERKKESEALQTIAILEEKLATLIS